MASVPQTIQGTTPILIREDNQALGNHTPKSLGEGLVLSDPEDKLRLKDCAWLWRTIDDEATASQVLMAEQIAYRF